MRVYNTKGKGVSTQRNGNVLSVYKLWHYKVASVRDMFLITLCSFNNLP